jgi:hypothetical protein
MAAFSILIEILRFFPQHGSDCWAERQRQRRKRSLNEALHVCMGGCVNLSSSARYPATSSPELEVGFGSWQIICLRRINIVSDFLRTSREGKNKMKSEIDKCCSGLSTLHPRIASACKAMRHFPS